MDIIKIEKKDRHLNSYNMSKNSLHTNDTYINTYNPIYEMLYKLYTR
jgi:hypothetical protein